MNTANRIKTGHGSILFKMSIAKQEAIRMTHTAKLGSDDVTIEYYFQDESLLAVKMINNDVTIQTQKE